jgi:pimeloyl-ACP methyl ester carboxylesterase
VTTVRAGKDDVLGDLVRSLFESGRAKVTKDFEELVVEPFSDPDPKPLTGLVPPKSLADVDSKFVTIEMDGESIVVHYKESLPTTTRENKTPNTDALVCMHGANGSTYSFRYLLPRVASAAGLRAIAIDRPPYGLTSRPPAPRYENKSENGNGNENEPKPNYHRVYTPEGQVEFTLKVMDALGIERAALLGHSAGAPVALDVALSEPTRCSALLAVAPAVFVGEKVSSEDDDKQESSSTKSSSGFKLPLDRAIRFAWFRFLIAQDGPGLNVVRGSVRRQTAAVEAGVTYADLDPETRAQYVKPTKTEGWDVGLLQLFRAGLGRFGSGGDRLRTELPKLADNKIKVLVLVGVLDETTPPALAEGFVEAMKQAGMLESDLQYVLLPDANHLPMEQTTFGVRESFEKIVVNKVLELV